LTPEEQILISDFMYECFQGLKTHKQVFDMNKLHSINNDTFKAWFAYNKNQFKQNIKVSKPKYRCLLV